MSPAISLRHAQAWILSASAAVLGGAAHADTLIKANNADSLNLPSSWTAAVVPGSSDTVRWDSTVTAARTVSLGGNLSWRGLDIVDPGGSVTFSTGSLLTLGSGGITTSPNFAITLNNAVALGEAQTWKVASNSLIPAGGVNTGGFALTLDGAGTKQFKKEITGGGNILIHGGTMRFSSASTAGVSAVIANPGTTLAYDTSTGPAVRAGNVTLNGAILTVGGLASADAIESNSGVLSIGPGRSTVTISPNATRNTRLSSSSFDRQERGIVLLRGTNFGTGALAPSVVNSSNIVFTTPPSLVGAGASGTTTLGILVGAYGDITTAGNGSGLLTHTPSHGVRLLDSSTEYVASIADGQTQQDNVLLANSSGALLTSTVNTSTVINSLSFRGGTTAGSGLTVNGTGTLTVASGVILGHQSFATSTAADSMILSGVTLDLNGREGIILFNTLNTGGGGTGGGPLAIESKITNDGGHGVTFCGTGLARIFGTTANDYTGPTTLLGGNLHLAKSAINAIPGNLVIYNGSVINSSNQVPDTADITIHGGHLAQKGALNSGSGASETFRDLFLHGGTYSDGAGGTSSGSTFLRNAVLTGGSWGISGGHKTNLGGSLAVSGGGQVKISAGSNSSNSTICTVSGGLTLTQISIGAFTPVIISSSAADTTAGGRLVLAGDVSFVGNGTNTNTVTVDSPAPTGVGNSGILALSGTRTFNIGDGAATDDLTIAAPIVDGSVAGGVFKSGAGTLVLARTNNYSGPTTVSAGTLRFSGGHSGDVTVQGAIVEFQNELFGKGSLSVTNGSQVVLGNTVSFDGVTIHGDVLAPGIYSHSFLTAAYPNLFNGSSISSAIINRGATWHLAGDQTAGSDWNSPPGSGWAFNPDGTGTNPFTINPYDIFDTNGHLLRTAATSSIFAGGILQTSTGSTLALLTTGGGISTIPNLNSSGGTISGTAGADTTQLLHINRFTNTSGTTTLSAAAGNGIRLTVDEIRGGGNIDLTGGGTFYPNFTDATDYTGTMNLVNGTLQFDTPATGYPFSSGGGLKVSTGTTVVLNEWAYFTGLTVGDLVKAPGTYPAASLGFSGSAGIVVYERVTTTPPQMFGVNLAGAEFGSNVPGVYGTDYEYPNDGEMAYYQSKGLRFIRVPFKWERMQRTLHGPLFAAELARMDAVVGYARNRGMKVLLDLHNYNKVSVAGVSHQVGSVEVPYSALQDVWSRLAEHYKDETGIYGYDIMNEPGGTLENWNAAAQATVHAIRLKDTSHYVFIEGVNWSGAQSWLSSNSTLKVVDPVDRVIYSAHSYWDSGYQNWSTNWKFDGTYGSYEQEEGDPEMGVVAMAGFISWLREKGYHGHIGEFGVPKNDARWNVVLEEGLKAMQDAGLSATYWAGGPRWGPYPISCEPTANFTVDAPQMSALQKFTGATFASWKSTYFTDSQLADPAMSGPLASPVGNGIANLLSYASGLNPMRSNVPSSVSNAAIAGEELTLTYVRNKSASDLDFIVEVSGDLMTWHSGPAYTSDPVVLGDDGFLQTVEMKDLVPSSSGSPRYIRLRVTGP